MQGVVVPVGGMELGDLAHGGEDLLVAQAPHLVAAFEAAQILHHEDPSLERDRRVENAR